MTTYRRFTVGFLLLLLLASAPLGAAEVFVVVVNAANPVTSLTKDQLARLFTKKDLRWPDGNKVAPVDGAPGSTVRKTFTQTIHGKDVAAIQSFWQRQLFSGRETPPAELGSDRAVLDFVAQNKSAIGYVAADTNLPAAVKVVPWNG
jgi:ABC-type phosphate transport system substrate-binding protein